MWQMGVKPSALTGTTSEMPLERRRNKSEAQLINARLELRSCDLPAGDSPPCRCSHQPPVYQQSCALMIDTGRTNYDTSVHSLSDTTTND